MNKKGFTLVELIAVIIILSIIILIAFGSFTTIQKQVLDSQYENVVKRIINASEDYARNMNTTDVLLVTVDELIINGYLSPDDSKDKIYDPRDNSSMNCYVVKVVFNDDEYDGVLQDKHELANGTCDNGYVQNNTIDILCNGVRCKNDWYNSDLTLSISGIDANKLKNGTVEWTNLLGDYSKQESGVNKTYKVAVNNVLSTTFNVLVKTSDGNYNLTKTIKIDKEKPTLVSKSMSQDYTKTQQLTLNGSDISGSGIAGYALLKNNNCTTATYTTNNVFNITSGGTYTICLKDKVGNLYNESFNINKVVFNLNDASNPTPRKQDVYFLEDDPNIPFMNPTRPGYDFKDWKDSTGRVHSASDLDNGDVVTGEWSFRDIETPADKIDKNSVGVVIDNRVNIILVLDESGSISSSDMNIVRSASRDFAQRMNFNIGSRLSIVMFDDSSNVHLNQATTMEKALAGVNSIPHSCGGTNFGAALSVTDNLICSMSDLTNTYVIFMSDGIGYGFWDIYRSDMISKGVIIYSIAVGDADANTLRSIASSPENYYSAGSMSDIFEIFTTIQDEIREDVYYKSVNGLIELPNLFINDEFPFVLTLKGTDYTYNSIASINHLLTKKGSTYYLDLVKVDNYFKTNGNLSTLRFVYYYNG